MTYRRFPAMSGIYAIRCIHEDAVYVGSSVNIPARWSIHASELAAGCGVNPRLQALWNDHGPTGFIFQVLSIEPDREKLPELEAQWTRTLGAENVCMNRLNAKGGPRTGISIHVSTKHKLEALGKGSMNDTLLYLLGLSS